jgi:hypothetical protein
MNHDLSGFIFANRVHLPTDRPTDGPRRAGRAGYDGAGALSLALALAAAVHLEK